MRVERQHVVGRIRGRLPRWALCLALLLLALPAAAQEGQVQIPLEAYQELVRQATRDPSAPVGYALGQAEVTVSVAESDDRATASVRLVLTARVLEDRWTLVPLLPPGTPVVAASINGAPAQLLATPSGLAWATNAAGTVNVEVSYRVDAVDYAGGRSLALPLPAVPGGRMSATVPGTGLALTVIPASGVAISESGGNTQVQATLAGGQGVQIAWRGAAVGARPAIGRAVYRGELLEREAVRWTAEYAVRSGAAEPALVSLISDDVALVSVTVDGDETPVTARDGAFAVAVAGRGDHVVIATFEVPVGGDAGRPRVEVPVPRVPVSRFELTLPGEKRITVEPAATVTHELRDGDTLAVAHLPMSDRVAFAWMEAVPDEPAETELVANATIVHTAFAEEGVLTVRATVLVEIARGETNLFALTVPEGPQINRIEAQGASVIDWRTAEVDGERVATVFFDRQVSGSLQLDVEYELLIAVGDDAADTPLPLLFARDVSRQRGMVALLSSRELTLEPVREADLTRVGENQLPAFVRDRIELTVAHTFRYFEARPELVVQARVPERRQGRFDAQLDTLVSLGDVTTSGSTAVAINVKSGTIMALDLFLPDGVNVLSLSAPSLRTYEVVDDEGRQRIAIEFTREMEGQFRVEVTYERINTDDDAEVIVPLIEVGEAEVEQGRIAVEALSAVEVRASTVENLSRVEFTELPQQILLRTTNPILLAFRYVQSDPRPRLGLRITRHRELEVQAAVIDLARYRTLVTRDGFSVTTATFTVRNSREQFLRVRLPAGSQVWSAAVDGEAETPALAHEDGSGADGSDEAGPEVLINIINSAEGFPVELVYATQLDPLGLVGAIEVSLPVPDMVVTRTRWDVDVPADARYGEPTTDFDVVASNLPVMGGSMDALANRAAVVEQPLNISVPEHGTRFSFEKLYANQAGAVGAVRIPYTSEESAGLAEALIVIGSLLFWLGLIGLIRKPHPVGVGWLAGIAMVGVAAVATAIAVFDASLDWPLRISAVAVVGLVALQVAGPVRRWLAKRDQSAAGTEADLAADEPPVEPPAEEER